MRSVQTVCFSVAVQMERDKSSVSLILQCSRHNRASVLTIAAGLEALLSRNNCWPVCLFIQWSSDRSFFTPPPAGLRSRRCYRYLHSFNEPMLFIYWHHVWSLRLAMPFISIFATVLRVRKIRGNHLETSNGEQVSIRHETTTIICPSRRHDHFPTFCELAWSSDIIVHFVQLHSVSHRLASFLWVQS